MGALPRKVDVMIQEIKDFIVVKLGGMTEKKADALKKYILTIDKKVNKDKRLVIFGKDTTVARNVFFNAQVIVHPYATGVHILDCTFMGSDKEVYKRRVYKRRKKQ